MISIRKTAADLIELRKQLVLTQSAMAAQMGMSLRALQEIENGRSECRPIHILAAERVSAKWALLNGDARLTPADLRYEAKALARLTEEPEN